MSKVVTVYGASDDLIEIDGEAPGCDEYPGESAVFVLHGDGARTWVEVSYESPGVWAIKVAPVDEDVPMIPAQVQQGPRETGTPGSDPAAYSAVAIFAGVERVEHLPDQ